MANVWLLPIFYPYITQQTGNENTQTYQVDVVVLIQHQVSCSVCLFVCLFFFSEGGELDLITLLFYKPFPPRPFPYCTSTTLSSFYLVLRVDFLVCWFIGVRLLHSTRRVPGGLGRVSNPSQLSHVQNVLLSLWGDAGKLFKFVGVEHVQFSHLLIDIA